MVTLLVAVSASAFAYAAAARWLPAWFDRAAAAAYRSAVERQFPVALDSLAAALRAGQSLAQAVAWTAREAPQPVAAEFARLDREMQLGRSFEEAFAEFAQRVPAPGPRAVALTVGPLRKAGANLIPAFEALADNLRRRAGTEEKMNALAAQAKMQLRLLAVIAPAVAAMLVVLEPAMARRLVSPEGAGVTFFAVVLQASSVLLARRILDPSSLWNPTGESHDPK